MDLHACRVCLATDDIKLYSFFKYKLSEAYEVLTGNQVSTQDGLPNYICSFCSALLLKSITFREKCCNAQDLLKYCLNEQSELTTEYVRSLNRNIHDLILPYGVSNSTPLISSEHKDDEVCIKEESELEVGAFISVMPSIESYDGIKDEEDKPVIRLKKRRKKKKKAEGLKQDEEEEELQDQSMDGVEDGLEAYDEEDGVYDVEELNKADLKNVEVVTLSRQQQLAEVAARRLSGNYLRSAYKCHRCYKGFMLLSTYGNHMERHDPKRGPYECDICGSRWGEERALRAHVTNAHRRKYVCRLCDFVCRSSHRAKEHCKWHNGFKYECKTCGATFGKSTSHLTHIRMHHPTSHSCELCGESFIGDFGLRMHKKRAHRGPMQCGCSVEFHSAEALRRHQGRADGGQCDPTLLWCGQCGLGFPSDEQLEEHLAAHPRGTVVSCDDCQRTFATQRSFDIHYQRVHLGVKMKQARPATGERVKRSPGQNIVCEVCGKKCVNKATLRYHQRIHTGEKPFECPQCPKRFSVLQRLQIHIRTHTGESPYQCKLCPKAFKHKAALNRHDRVHTGVKPYTCSHCGKSFSQSNSMKLHVNTVHLKMPAPYRSRRKN